MAKQIIMEKLRASSSASGNRALRVLFIGFSYIINLYQAKLYAFVNTGRVDVGLICPTKWRFRSWTRTFTLEAHYPNIRFYPAKINLFNGRAGAYVYPISTFLRTLLDFKPDMIYIEQEVFSLSAFEIAVFAHLFKIPLAMFCWENIDRQISFVRRWTRKFVLNTAQLITPGNRGAEKLLRAWGYSGVMEVLPQLGVDTTLFFPRPNAKINKPFSIGFAGRLVYEKGVDLILVAAKILADRGYKFRVVICGIGPHENILRRQAEISGIAGRVEWLGEYKYEDVPNAIAEMDVLVLPSRTIAGKWQEQFGHVLIEAMSMGVPVIGSSSGAIPDVVGREDLIFTENDASGLAKNLERILTDQLYRDQVVKFGLARVNEMFTNESVASRLTAQFEMLVGKNKEH